MKDHPELDVFYGGRRLKAGFTTGTSAAAAAKAAAEMLCSGQRAEAVMIGTPAGPELCLPVCGARVTPDEASCAVQKDAGDDPDVTDGMLIRASVRRGRGSGEGGEENTEDSGTAAPEEKGIPVFIEGGEGIGRVTRPGLDQPPGNAAINSVPRRMIREAVAEVLSRYGEKGPVTVTISAPGGREAAEKTFNPRLGIEGGISILGTTGIVRPMSRQALFDTIRADVRVHAAEDRYLIAVPGALGMRFLTEHYGFPESRAVLMSNFIGETIDAAAESGAKGLLIAGHLGKLVKLAGGIMYTHSRDADGRLEIMAAHALKAGAPAETAREMLECVTTDAASAVLLRAGYLECVLASLARSMEYYAGRRAGDALKVGVSVFVSENGAAFESGNVPELLKALRGGPSGPEGGRG